MENYILGETLLKIDNLSFSIEGNLILKNINLEVKDIIRPNSGIAQGQVISLLAPSGIGKSQLFNIISGITPKKSKSQDFGFEGDVKIGIEQQDPQMGLVGLVQQNYPLFNHRTVLDNLKIAAKRLPKEEANIKIQSFLEHFGLEKWKDRYPMQLSGGTRQRVAIAQQLLKPGHFLLLDEPFSGLDPNLIDRVSEMIIKISTLHELNTIIIVSHDIDSTCAISDTVWLMGKDKDEKGNYIDGAVIKEQYCLMDMGLAWRKDIRHDKQFMELTASIRDKFKYLG